MRISMIAIGLSLLLITPLHSKENDNPEDPTKPVGKPFISPIQAAVNRTMQTGKNTEVKVKLPLNQIHYLPEIPHAQLASISFTGRVVPVEGNGDKIPRRWRIQGTMRGKGKVALKVYPNGIQKKSAKIKIFITFE